MGEFISEIVAYILYPESAFSPGVFHAIQIIRAILITFLILGLAMIVFLIAKSGYIKERYSEDYSEFLKAKKEDKEKNKKWEKIFKKAKSGDVSERRLAVMEADEALNDVFIKMGYEEGKLEDKIASLNKDVVLNIDELKTANRKKIDIVGDPNYNISKEEAEKLVTIYSETLESIKSI